MKLLLVLGLLVWATPLEAAIRYQDGRPVVYQGNEVPFRSPRNVSKK